MASEFLGSINAASFLIIFLVIGSEETITGLPEAKLSNNVKGSPSHKLGKTIQYEDLSSLTNSFLSEIKPFQIIL